MSATVEIAEDDGTYTAVDVESGAFGTGKTKAMALVALATALEEGTIGSAGEDDVAAELRALSTEVQHQFRVAGVTEEDVDEAIKWARSR